MVSKNADTTSITTLFTLPMPRVGPREELFLHLKNARFDNHLEMEEKRRMLELNYSLLFRGFDNQNSTHHHSRISKPIRSSLSRYMRSRSQLQYLRETLNSRYQLELINYLMTVRYLEERISLPKSLSWLSEILPSYSDERFQRFARMSRQAFGEVVHILETHAKSFFHVPGKQKQLPVSVQLHLALFTLSHYGNAAGFCECTALYGYSERMIYKARRRICRDLMSLGQRYIQWPDAAERRSLCKRAKQKYGFEWAFFLVDGTTHPFATVPSYDRHCWFDRKSRYSMQALVSCDMDLRVRHIVVGWPGSTHDSRVLRSADYMIEANSSQYFTGNEHGLGDAAFGMQKRVVPNYKEPLASIPANREYNLIHSSFRVLSEHCIGKVKNRFQGLKDVRMQLRKRKDVEEVVAYTMAGYVLHNILCEIERDEASFFDAGGGSDFEDSNSTTTADDPEDCTAEHQGTEEGNQFREIVKHQVLRAASYE